MPIKIKLILATLGIRDLTIRFDNENKQICAEFAQAGQVHHKNISFSEVEAMFSDTDFAAVKGSQGRELDSAGQIPTP